MKQLYTVLFFIGIILINFYPGYAQSYLVTPSWQQNAVVNDLKFSGDGTRLITVGNDINIWHAHYGSLIKNIPPIVANPFRSVAISKDGKSFVTGNGTYTCDDYCYAINAYLSKYSIDGTLNMHISTGESYADALDYSPDGKTIAAAFTLGYYDVDGIVSVYDTALNGIKSFNDNIPYGAASVQFTPDGKYIISGEYENGAAKIWDYNSGALVHSLAHGGYTTDGGNNLHISISPDSKYVVTGGLGSPSGKVKVWRISDGALIYSFNTNFIGTGSNVQVIPSFSADGKYIIAGISNGTIPAEHKFMIWNFAKGTLLKESADEPGYISAITFSPQINNKYLFAYGLNTSGTVSTVNVISIDGNNAKTLPDIITEKKPVPVATAGNVELLSNPFTNLIKLKISGTTQGKVIATVSDLSGRPVTKAVFDNVNNQTLSIPLNGKLNSGIYMLNVQLNNTTFNFRLIKN